MGAKGGDILNQRVKEIRRTNNLTMDKFGERLGVTKVAISRIESGERNITDQMVRSICREFDINEEWLRTGEGEMYLDNSREMELARLTKTLLSEESDSFKNRLISALARLNEEQWELLAQISEEITKE